MSRPWILLLTLAGSLCLAILVWRSLPKEFAGLISEPTTTPTYPTAFITQAHTKQFNEQGQLSYALDAQKINYFENRQPTQAEIIFEKPYLTIYNYDGQSAEKNTITTISADTAEGSEQEDRLTLKTNVEIKQTGVDGQITTLSTEHLIIQPERRYAESDKPVIIADETGTTLATGIKVFFDDKRIELLSNVKGKYVPK